MGKLSVFDEMSVVLPQTNLKGDWPQLDGLEFRGHKNYRGPFGRDLYLWYLPVYALSNYCIVCYKTK